MIKQLDEIVRKCGFHVWELRQRSMGEEDKVEQLGQHFSTRADRESQEIALAELHKAFPGEIVIAEEQEHQAAIPPDCIVVDPLDGTTNFFNRRLQNGVTICVLRNHQPFYAAAFFTASQTTITAVRGAGCYAGGHGTGKRIKSIPWHGKMDKTQIAIDIGSWTLKHDSFDTVLRPLAERFNILSIMSAVVTGREVLMGEVGAYANLGIAKIWDAAGMVLAIEEAGGVVCDPWGKPLEWKSVECDWVMAGNRQVADAVLTHTSNWQGRKT